MEPHIDIQRIGKTYGRTQALDQITLTIPEGAFLGILGPNGAGKSTFINILAQVIRQTEGEILWRGQSILKVQAEWKRSMGVVLEDLALFDFLTLEEHLVFASKMYGLSNAECTYRTDELLHFLRLGEYRKVLCHHASTGMRKKLAFGLALVHAPRLLFLDEVLTGVDPVSARDIGELLLSLNRQGTTVVLASHLVETVERLLQDVIILVRGTIAYNGSVKQISGHSLSEHYVSTISLDREQPSPLRWLYSDF
jgi:ABC-2 type transport system ATP-binding protein